MPYDITKYEPGYGGLINSAGNVVNQADGIISTGARLSSNDVVVATMQNAATATGNGTILNTANSAFVVLDVQGTFVGTVTFEYTVDGTNYYPLELVRQSDKSLQSTATAAGQFAGRVSSLLNIRARISAYTSGSITVYGRASSNGTGHHTVTIVNNTFASIGDTSISSSLLPANSNYLYNGTSWDAWRNNQGFTALAYADRTATTSTADIINVNHRGIIVYFYVGVVSGTGSVTLMIEGKDPSGARYRQCVSSYTAKTTTGMTAHVLYPGASGTANYNNADANVLPYQFRFTITHADSSTYRYSVAYALIM